MPRTKERVPSIGIHGPAPARASAGKPFLLAEDIERPAGARRQTAADHRFRLAVGERHRANRPPWRAARRSLPVVLADGSARPPAPPRRRPPGAALVVLRSSHRQDKSVPFDLLVIGGGIHGAGIARDADGPRPFGAARRAAQPGLPYLLRVLQAGARRTALSRVLQAAPGQRIALRTGDPARHRPASRPPPCASCCPTAAACGRPGPSALASCFTTSSAAGAASKALPASASKLRPLAQPLNRNQHSGFAYSDCAVDDSRLVILTAKDAAERGAQVRVGQSFLHAAREGGVWHAHVHDVATGKSRAVNARAIVNAAGPWVGEVLTVRLGSAAGTRSGSSRAAISSCRVSMRASRRMRCSTATGGSCS